MPSNDMRNFIVSGTCKIGFSMIVQAKDEKDARDSVASGCVFHNHINDSAGTIIKSSLEVKEY